MVDAIMTFGFTIFCAVMILIIATVAYLSTAFLIALAVAITVSLAAWFIGWILNPRPRRDHYEAQFSEYPFADPKRVR